ncbi:hypothetical protein [Rhodoferax sp.]|nr:hypothetical protein [Rhodoferax sp.]MDD2924775.1 hypothetical protein [Rhodoferax sp.]
MLQGEGEVLTLTALCDARGKLAETVDEQDEEVLGALYDDAEMIAAQGD